RVQGPDAGRAPARPTARSGVDRREVHAEVRVVVEPVPAGVRVPVHAGRTTAAPETRTFPLEAGIDVLVAGQQRFGKPGRDRVDVQRTAAGATEILHVAPGCEGVVPLVVQVGTVARLRHPPLRAQARVRADRLARPRIDGIADRSAIGPDL